MKLKMEKKVYNFEIKKVIKESKNHNEYLVYLNGEFLVGADMEKGLVTTTHNGQVKLEEFLKVKASDYPDKYLMENYCPNSGPLVFYKEFEWCGIKKENGELSILINTYDSVFENSIFNFLKLSVAIADIIQKSKKTKPGSKNYFSIKHKPHSAVDDGFSIYYNCPYTETTTIEDVYNAALKELQIVYKQAVLNLVKEFTKD